MSNNENRPLNIVVIGYYGKLNAGDDLLQQSICNIFQNHNLLFTSWFPGTDFLNTADLVVVGGGSIWPGNPFFENGKKIAKSMKTPLIVIGISAKNENSKILKQTLPLLEKSLFFQVRDSDSKIILGNHERITVGPDLYWWSQHDTPPNKNHQFNNTVSLNLRSWKNIDWSPRCLVETIAKHTNRILPFPLYFGSPLHEKQGALQDVTILEQAGIDQIPESFTLRNLEKSSIVVAMRFHALLVSLRSGQPAIGFNYHKKITSLYKEINMPELCVPLNDYEALGNAIELIKYKYPAYKEKSLLAESKFISDAKVTRTLLEKILVGIEPSKESLSNKFRRAAKRLLH